MQQRTKRAGVAPLHTYIKKIQHTVGCYKGRSTHTETHRLLLLSLPLSPSIVGPCLKNAWGSPTYGNTKYEIPLVRYTLATLRKSRKNRIILEVHEALFTLEQKQNSLSLSCLCLKPKNCKTRRKKKRAVAIFALAIDASSAYSRILGTPTSA